MSAELDFQEHQVRGVELHSSGQTGAGSVGVLLPWLLEDQMALSFRGCCLGNEL